jgi:hypothetical protein
MGRITVLRNCRSYKSRPYRRPGVCRTGLLEYADLRFDLPG